MQLVEAGHSASIRGLTFSADESLLASVADDKKLVICSTHSFSRVASRVFPKKLSCLCFVQDHVVLTADKFGVVYKTSAEEIEKQGPSEPFGHYGMITDLKKLGSFVVTSDVDERIRVSHWPETFRIENFLLGHTKFVVSISLNVEAS